MILRHGHLRLMRLARAQTQPISPFSILHPTRNSTKTSTSSSIPDSTPPPPDTDQKAPLPPTIRHLMRQVPQPLTAITAHNPITQQIHGLLASSFTTITLSPTPLVSVNIQLPSATWASIAAAGGRFTASSLNDERTARALAKDNSPAQDGAAINVRNLASRSGRLRRGMGGVWWMRCVCVPGKCVAVGDHVLLVAEVLEAEQYPDAHDVGRALVYFHGRYVSVHRLMRFVAPRHRTPRPKSFRFVAGRNHAEEAKRTPGRRVKTLEDLL